MAGVETMLDEAGALGRLQMSPVSDGLMGDVAAGAAEAWFVDAVGRERGCVSFMDQEERGLFEMDEMVRDGTPCAWGVVDELVGGQEVQVLVDHAAEEDPGIAAYEEEHVPEDDAPDDVAGPGDAAAPDDAAGADEVAARMQFGSRDDDCRELPQEDAIADDAAILSLTSVVCTDDIASLVEPDEDDAAELKKDVSMSGSTIPELGEAVSPASSPGLSTMPSSVQSPAPVTPSELALPFGDASDKIASAPVEKSSEKPVVKRTDKKKGRGRGRSDAAGNASHLYAHLQMSSAAGAARLRAAAKESLATAALERAAAAKSAALEAAKRAGNAAAPPASTSSSGKAPPGQTQRKRKRTSASGATNGAGAGGKGAVGGATTRERASGVAAGPGGKSRKRFSGSESRNRNRGTGAMLAANASVAGVPGVAKGGVVDSTNDDKGMPVKEKCIKCKTTAKNTPMMRKGPDGCRSLCNACGLKWSRHGIY